MLVRNRLDLQPPIQARPCQTAPRQTVRHRHTEGQREGTYTVDQWLLTRYTCASDDAGEDQRKWFEI